MKTTIHTTISSIGEKTWNSLASTPVFLDYRFFNGLEQSDSLATKSGWGPLYFVLEDSDKLAILYSFAKKHSYGEYIFDWSWADAYHHHGLDYYPKLTSMIPFTPATTNHFLMQHFDESLAHRLLDSYEAYYAEHNYSTNHFLFLCEKEIPIFSSREYLIRESLQYHFLNPGYKDFSDFLSTVKNKKAKQIRKERLFSHEITIAEYSGDQIRPLHAQELWHFYLATIAQKGAIPYLNKIFFSNVFHNMKEHILYINATRGDKVIAGALFFFDQERLYGRYWGAHENHPNLHFELCYYRGIDFCIKNKLSVFEAGAQGEHKIGRGFTPSRTYSAHQIKNPLFKKAIENFIHEEKKSLQLTIESLQKRLPFKN